MLNGSKMNRQVLKRTFDGSETTKMAQKKASRDFKIKTV